MGKGLIVAGVLAVAGVGGAVALRAGCGLSCGLCGDSAKPAASIVQVSQPAAVAALAAAAAVPQAEGAYEIDSVHSMAIFRVTHNSVANFYGRFNKPAGSFQLDETNPAKSVLDVTIKTENIDTADEKRNAHLKSQDFFSAKEFPTISFKGKSFKKSGDKTFDVTGDLTIRGQTKKVTVKVENTGSGEGMRGGQVAGIEARFTIKRSEYGVSYGIGKPLGDDVDIIVSLEGGK